MTGAQALKYLLVSQPTPLIALGVLVLAPEPETGVSYQVGVVIRPLSPPMILVLMLILVVILATTTLALSDFFLVLGFIRGCVLVSSCHDFPNGNWYSLI